MRKEVEFTHISSISISKSQKENVWRRILSFSPSPFLPSFLVDSDPTPFSAPFLADFHVRSHFDPPPCPSISRLPLLLCSLCLPRLISHIILIAKENFAKGEQKDGTSLRGKKQRRKEGRKGEVMGVQWWIMSVTQLDTPLNSSFEMAGSHREEEGRDSERETRDQLSWCATLSISFDEGWQHGVFHFLFQFPDVVCSK